MYSISQTVMKVHILFVVMVNLLFLACCDYDPFSWVMIVNVKRFSSDLPESIGEY